jgi:hypothetical protein
MYKLLICFCFVFVSCANLVYAAGQTPEPSHGIAYPVGWQNWGTIAISHRIDNNTIRVVLGNDIAINAARNGKTNPWPDGAILGKVVWKETKLENWKEAIVPDKLVHAEFMFKDSKKYSQSYDWGWARWVGLEQKPFNLGTQVCTGCHTPVKNRDWVFTEPAIFPK